MTTPLRFEGSVSAVKQNISEYGGTLMLTLTVKEPRKPSRPTLPYECIERGVNPKWKPRPELPKRKAKEEDAAYKARCEPLRASQAAYDAAIAKYRDDVANFEAEWHAYTEQLQEFMWLSGSVGILGSKPMTVVLEPMNRGFAEMETLLLPPAVDVTPALAEPDDAVIDFTPPKLPDVEPGDSLDPADDVPCPKCKHLLDAEHDFSDAFPMGGCVVELTEGGSELCPCDISEEEAELARVADAA